MSTEQTEDGTGPDRQLYESVMTSVGAVDGPAHTGSGDQYNTFQLLGLSGSYREVNGRVRRNKPLRLITQDQRYRSSTYFVAPAGYLTARSILLKNRLVVLSGTPGSGRRTAAVVLLESVGDSDAGFRELPEDSAAGFAEPERVLDTETLRQGDRLLLDLSGDQQGAFSGIQPRLETYRDALRVNDAYLVVVIPHDQDYEVADEFRHLVARLGRPDGVRVLERHLRSHGTDFDSGQLRSHPVAKWAVEARLGEVAHLARLVHDACLAAPNAGTKGWLTDALDALSERRGEAARAIAGLASSWERAVLLSAALLNGGNIETVFAAAHELMGFLRTPVPDTPPLERRLFPDQLVALDVRIRSDRTVEFTRLGYAEAVLECFWDGHPDLTPVFQRWVDRCIRVARLTPTDRDAVAERFAGQCLRLGFLDDLFGQVRRWAVGQGRGQSLAPQAAHVLARLLTDSEAGWAARRRVYAWATEKALAPELAQVLIGVSADAIASRWPDEALVRLHHLARNKDPKVRESAVSALLELTEKPGLYRLLLNRIAAAIDGAHRQADLELLVPLTRPDRMLARGRGGPFATEQRVRADAVRGIAAALGDDEALRHYTERFLEACAADGAAGLLLDVLVEAGQEAERVNRLYAVARRWALASEHSNKGERVRAVAELIERVDRAQGLAPLPTSSARENAEVG
ncbi:hypothetical protein [Nocardiopsis ansamitocini]|uniref:Uncharacterized protein n=1 Tax=Nocardiopsis ansamitocini TaxID=1670832 RepID=A0A9W6P3D2_9ACTN|nr:hypothetical protein [Nocardiopsis ansamitocini]GLU46529.1 hypothetical protein Nans01_08800 [Nocardiopsis ansamitocini]